MIRQYFVDRSDQKLVENAHAVECTAMDIRNLINELDDEDLVYALDNAQGEVFSGSSDHAYVLIKISSKE
jgi:hypothetical protein